MFTLAFPQDRQWKIIVDEVPYLLTEYNDEITGFDDALHKLAPDIIHYGGNAYYATGRFAKEKGWTVEPVERDAKVSLEGRE